MAGFNLEPINQKLNERTESMRHAFYSFVTSSVVSLGSLASVSAATAHESTQADPSLHDTAYHIAEGSVATFGAGLVGIAGSLAAYGYHRWRHGQLYELRSELEAANTREDIELTPEQPPFVMVEMEINDELLAVPIKPFPTETVVSYPGVELNPN